MQICFSMPPGGGEFDPIYCPHIVGHLSGFAHFQIPIPTSALKGGGRFILTGALM